MKKIIIAAALVIVVFSSSAQNINIPDANFKNYLVTQLTIDTDGDFFADASADMNADGEIDQTEALAINYVSVGGLNISSLEGVQFLTNLRGLYFNNNQVVSVDLHTLSHLKHIECSNNLLTSIDLCGTAATSLWAESNPNLTFISIKNNVISTYEITRPATASGPPPLPSFMFDTTSLQTVCYDQGEYYAIDFLQSSPQITLTTDCVSNCTADPNIITGNIKFDFNLNGCDAADADGGFPIKVSQSGQPNSTFYASNGAYTYYTYEDNLTLTPQLGNSYYTISPAAALTTYTGTGNAQTIDFCVMPNGDFPDLSIDFAQGTNARPGFDTVYYLYYKNKGTTPLSGQISVEFDDARLDFLGANPAIAAQSNGVLTWNFTDITPFQTRYISFTLNVNSPAEVPPVNVGDQLSFAVNITPASVTDVNLIDNTDLLTQIVRGSFDPNDLTVSQYTTHIEPPLESLNYTIRFQNTGNAPAEKVVVTDLLDSRFDRSSLEVIGASHAFRSFLKPDNTLEFTFDGINLPPSVSDEPGSHGFVTFKIKPIEGSVIEGDILNNEANIYFDFNLPIATNSVSTSYFQALGRHDFVGEKSITVYPNPVKNVVNISSAKKIESIAIYNAMGQMVKSALPNADNTRLDVMQLKAGIYYIEVVSDSTKTSKKFIKL